MSDNRKHEAYRFRMDAAEMARSRVHPIHEANGDEERYASANYAMSFTKGLEHDETTGLLKDAEHFRAFRKAVNEGFVEPFTFDVPGAPTKKRQWEAPTAGIVFELQGPDPQAVTMPPAPKLGSDELVYEMAEVYELALLRDVPFTEFESGDGIALDNATARLNALTYKPVADCCEGRPRKVDSTGEIDAQTAFRGSSPGVEVGPYLSQFLLIGSEDTINGTKLDDGFIGFGNQKIDQRVRIAKPKKDYLTDTGTWLKAQNGEDLRDNCQLFNAGYRFIATPRDLATYVHDDALYQAYLNACIVLLGMDAPFDPSFDNLSGGGKEGKFPKTGAQREAGGFALWGGPHILTLVTEVATRALKAVRYQKFNNHMRLRPEALAARIHYEPQMDGVDPSTRALFRQMKGALDGGPTSLLPAILNHNSLQNQKLHPPQGGTLLLPMAFQEGSPMHPSYGAGHATVAGACVTILKAYFDTSAVFIAPEGGEPKFKRYKAGEMGVVYRPKPNGTALVRGGIDVPLTLEGELNKLAANISIGRNMAGVHFFSDYYDSVRMGEEIAIGLLEEQALGYKTDPFVLSVPTFDGKLVRIGRR